MSPARRRAACLALLLASAGCGGESQPAANPDNAPSAAPADTTPPAPPAASSSAAAIPPAPTAPASTAAPAPPPPPPAAPITVGALEVPASKKEGNPKIVVKADGTVTAGGKPVAKFSGAELQDTGGKTILAVAGDGTVTGPDVDRALKFAANDDLQLGDGSKLSVGDDGTSTVTDPSGKPDKAPFKIKGVTAATRRAAVLVLVAYAMLRKPASGGGATMSSTPPLPPPPPPPPPPMH